MSKLQAMTDDELQAARDALPKYLNEMTGKQAAESQELYAEQMRRYKLATAAGNAEIERVTGLHHGDKVSYHALGFGGLGGETYQGKVIYNRGGRLVVRTTHADGSGRKTFPIHKGWRKEA